MWTRLRSPHRPSRLSSPAASRSQASLQTLAETAARGKGRWCSTTSPLPMSPASSVMALSQDRRDVAEPDDQRRRQEQAGDQHKAEMHGHRHVGGLDLGGRAFGVAESEIAEMREQGTERDENAQHQRDRQPRLTREGRSEE